ncbi:gluconate 2-dehydrogenase subunit 3 family protein [Gilvimarinus chinensis]|uniref:gluconate 2-dehydrogenase subunit 3 family protein n=1 Tax=Gilvimarinus chinensis TaxID=396005 RepID=UPI00036093DA|nr:gluconate 2-dehydrogenase subunit 3 family protein [Gilvimarinus chinensis]
MTHPQPVTDASKRHSLKTFAGLLGLSLSASAIDALAEYKAPATDTKPQLFNPKQLLCTAALAEIIIPTTETAGAKTVGAHNYIDYHLRLCATESEQKSVTNLLDKLNAIASKEYSQHFESCSNEQQQELVDKLHRSESPFSAAETGTWRFLISLVVFAYYTSEQGATKELNYLPIPGGYNGDVPFSEVGRAWSLQPFV